MSGPRVTDAEIDALTREGWDWHAAYRFLQSVAHAEEARESQSDDSPVRKDAPNA